MIETSFAQDFSTDWIHAWNKRDLEKILSHYHDDFEMHSPLIIKITGEISGKLKGKEAIKAYWAQALQLAPNLNLELISVLTGVNSIILYYKSIGGKLAAECFYFDANKKVVKAFAHYAI